MVVLRHGVESLLDFCHGLLAKGMGSVEEGVGEEPLPQPLPKREGSDWTIWLK